jgi:DNA polymerase-3 subunit chi
MAMGAVAFHFNVPQRQDYTCRLLRKACRAGARVAVTGDAAVLSELDRQLWIFDPIDFVPHWRGASAERLPARLSGTPIVLLDQAGSQAGHDVLLNLAEQVPDCAPEFSRVIEVVGRSEAERAYARLRWRHYAGLGAAIERHEVRA